MFIGRVYSTCNVRYILAELHLKIKTKNQSCVVFILKEVGIGDFPQAVGLKWPEMWCTCAVI